MAIEKPKAFWPLTITTSNQRFYLQMSAGPTDYTANIAPGTYLSASDLATALATALNALGTGGTWTVQVDSATGLFTIFNSGFTWKVRFGTFTTNSAASVLGFFSINSPSFLIVTTGHFQHANGWYADVATRKDSLPTFDRSMDRHTVTMGGQNKLISEVELTKRKVVLAHLKPWKTLVSREAISGTHNNEALERLWRDGAAKFRWWPDQTDDATFADYFLDEDTRRAFEPERQYATLERYEVTLGFRGYVP